MEKIMLGSIYLDGVAREPEVSYDGGQIRLGKSVPGMEIQWVKLKSGLLIADRCVCTDINWEQLDDHGLVFGAPFQIDGQFYLCRCLKVGAGKDVPNEWDAALDATDDSDSLWHWKVFFWGQETPPGLASRRAVRGYHSARYWYDSGAAGRHASVGFRPALEPLGSEPCSPDTLIGKAVRLYGVRGAPLEGRLLDVDDYDFTITPAAGMPIDCFWASKAGDNLVVSRDGVLWLK